MNSTFEGSTLFISARSPFARRVRVALLENGIGYQEKVLDVFQPSADLWSANPLARVPTLLLKDKRVLIDSNVILQAIYEEHADSPFFPHERKLEVLHGCGLAAGLCDKAVEYFLETIRPASLQDQELFAELEGIFDRTLTAFDKALGGREYLVDNGGRPTQADFDLGCALAYIRLRHPKPWLEKLRNCAALMERLDARPSFKKTAPPPPA